MAGLGGETERGQRRLRRVRSGPPDATLITFLFNEHSENYVLEESLCLPLAQSFTSLLLKVWTTDLRHLHH